MRGSSGDIGTGQWLRDIDLNLTSVYYCLKHQIPALLRAGGRAIVNNVSSAGIVGTASLSPYPVAKHGVVGPTKATALDYTGQGVRINALLTGAVDTPALGLAGSHPVGRLAEPGEIAACAVCSLSDDASFITGAALAVDGGGYTTGMLAAARARSDAAPVPRSRVPHSATTWSDAPHATFNARRLT